MGVFLLLIFGLLSLLAIPVQLIADVDRPKITVQTTRLGASPQEIEEEMVIEQEDMLKNLEELIPTPMAKGATKKHESEDLQIVVRGFASDRERKERLTAP